MPVCFFVGVTFRGRPQGEGKLTTALGAGDSGLFGINGWPGPFQFFGVVAASSKEHYSQKNPMRRARWIEMPNISI